MIYDRMGPPGPLRARGNAKANEEEDMSRSNLRRKASTQIDHTLFELFKQ